MIPRPAPCRGAQWWFRESGGPAGSTAACPPVSSPELCQTHCCTLYSLNESRDVALGAAYWHGCGNCSSCTEHSCVAICLLDIIRGRRQTMQTQAQGRPLQHQLSHSNSGTVTTTEHRLPIGSVDTSAAWSAAQAHIASTHLTCLLNFHVKTVVVAEVLAD